MKMLPIRGDLGLIDANQWIGIPVLGFLDENGKPEFTGDSESRLDYKYLERFEAAAMVRHNGSYAVFEDIELLKRPKSEWRLQDGGRDGDVLVRYAESWEEGAREARILNYLLSLPGVSVVDQAYSRPSAEHGRKSGQFDFYPENPPILPHEIRQDVYVEAYGVRGSISIDELGSAPIDRRTFLSRLSSVRESQGKFRIWMHFNVESMNIRDGKVHYYLSTEGLPNFYYNNIAPFY